MNAEQSRSGEFRPGDRVKVIDGTFVGLEGRVIDLKEAREMWESGKGGEQPCARPPAICGWVLLSIFSRPVPVMLVRDQIQHATS
jgi:transcription antitermination factor NusG